MAGTYEAIATASSGGSSITFSSIPQTYTDLILVANIHGGSADNGWIQLNGDANARYSQTSLSTNNAGWNPSGFSSVLYSVVTALQAKPLIYHIMNYTSAVGYKVMLFKTGDVAYGGTISSAMYRDTAAITSVTLATQGYATLGTGDITLYGIKAA